MGYFESILAFIFAMTILSIPIIAILRRTPQRVLIENAELAKRISVLELKQMEREQELSELRKEISFMQRLIDAKAGKA